MSILSDIRRLVLEHRKMRERWGQTAKWCCDPSRTTYWWEVPIRVEGNTFQVRILYPENYPACPPEIIIDSPLPAGTPHLLTGRRMCWFFPGETQRNQNKWSPAEDTAALAVGVAYRWFLAFLVWNTTGQWPVPDAVRLG